jgi:hypothetical protein
MFASLSRLMYTCILLYKHSLSKASEQARPTMHSARLLSQGHNPPQASQMRRASPLATVPACAILTIFLEPATCLFIHYTGARNEEIKPGSGEVIHV